MSVHKMPIALAACFAAVGCFASVAELDTTKGERDAGVGGTGIGGSSGGVAGAAFASGGSPTSGGSGPNDGKETGTTGGAGGADSGCADPANGQCGGAAGSGGTNCQTCVFNQCSAELTKCMSDIECKQLSQCAAACSDESCLQACAEKDPQSGGSTWWELMKCVEMFCASACQSGGGGSSGAGGWPQGGAAGVAGSGV